jgi:GNAT superfamily N-acetyltransferase
VKVRPIIASDLGVISEMTFDFETHLHSLIKKKPRVSESKIRSAYRKASLGNSDSCGGFIAEDRHGAVGFALCYLGYRSDQNGSVLAVPDLFVRERARGKGVGKQLMAALRKHAKARGCVRLELSVWNHNPRALKFYLDLGLQPISDEILLRWRIG